ncbi:MAG: iron-sulfur cluster carrier protein ApbC [Proteobacteria bacterium]|nr:MAG: iron-sulfur cluster carrier protein ApbC [Pseudomonadota bacterium]
MSITATDVLKALSYVEEPDLGKDLVTLNMIENVQINGKNISFTVILTTPACPLKDMIRNACIRAIHTMVDKDAEVTVNMTSRVTTARQNNEAVLGGIKNIIAIASGKGGVGKSTVTSNLAIALAQTGAKVGLVDADIFGPSVPVMFGTEDEKPFVKPVNGKNMIVPVERYGVKLMSIGYLAPSDSAVVWRGPMASSALKQILGDVLWGELDYLLIDLPPGTSDIHLTLVQTVPVTGVVIVTTPQKVALADAQKGLQMFRQPQINVPVLGIVENMSWFENPETGKPIAVFGSGGGTHGPKLTGLHRRWQAASGRGIGYSSNNRSTSLR